MPSRDDTDELVIDRVETRPPKYDLNELQLLFQVGPLKIQAPRGVVIGAALLLVVCSCLGGR